MVVNYDSYNTEEVTAEDMIEAISARYGPATRPVAEIVLPSAYGETLRVIARWEDSQYSFNLVRFSSENSFGVVGFSKQLDALARIATVDSEVFRCSIDWKHSRSDRYTTNRNGM
jgi:hypothetical protein